MLSNVYFGHNQLSGDIPAFGKGLDSLSIYSAGHNRLTGPFPDLSGLPQLVSIFLQNNQLSGTIPSLAGLPLTMIYLDHNAFTGDPPEPPPGLGASGTDARLCPNHLNPVPSAAWDAAGPVTPWYQPCVDGQIFTSGFEEPLPDF